MPRTFTDQELAEIKEHLQTINDLGPTDAVIEQARLGDFDEYTLRGDDGAAFFWATSELMKIFQIETDLLKRISGE